MTREAVLTSEAAATLRRLAASAYPEEGCGVLVGEVADGCTTIVEVTAARNLVVDRRRDRYELDPGAILAAERRARALGREVVGFWHTHPDHPARPSGFDTERAWPDYLYVIARVTARGVEEVRAFRLGDDEGMGFVEVPLVVPVGAEAPTER